MRSSRIAADDEERVVDAEREAHAREHVHDEDREVERLPDERGQGKRDDDGHERCEYRHEAGDDRAEDEKQDDQRGGDTELELPLLEIVLGQALVVLVGGELAGDRRLEALALRGVDRVDDLADPVLSARGQGHRDERGVPVGRDERAIAGLVERSCRHYVSRAFDVRHQGCHVTLERGLLGRDGGRPDDDHLVDDLLRVDRKVLPDQCIAPVRLRVVRHLPLGRQRRPEQHHDDDD